jgi:hypothetical protein
MAGLACWFWSKAWQAVGDSLPMSVTELAGDFVPFALPILKGQCDVGDNFDDSNRSADAVLAQLATDKSHSVCHRVTYNEQSAVPVHLASLWQAYVTVSADVAIRHWRRVMVINNDFEFGYLVIAFGFLGIILLGSLLAALHLDRWHPKLIGAIVGALLGVALIEAVPMFT